MNIGISVPLPAYLVDVGFMARKVEELGFESFWCAEHPFMPVQSRRADHTMLDTHRRIAGEECA